MLNQVVLVGRLTKEPELIELENGKNRSSFINEIKDIVKKR